jgi:ADP-ribose pyrophosphatase
MLSSVKPWKTLSSRPVYENRWMKLREDIAELPNGKTTLYGVVTFGECVGVLPFLDPDHVILCRQYRYVFGENHRWEMPTGGMKPAEKPEQAAQRELQEEAGYTAGKLEWVSSYYTSKSVCHETAHLYLGYDLKPSSLPPDDTEFFETAVFSFDEALEMVNRSEIRDGMTVIAILQAALARNTSTKNTRSST